VKIRTLVSSMFYYTNDSLQGVSWRKAGKRIPDVMYTVSMEEICAMVPPDEFDRVRECCYPRSWRSLFNDEA